MSIIDAVIQGAIQGLTEFLPVSSSGHLSVYQHVFGYSGDVSNMTFNLALHLGTLVAVIIAFAPTVWALVKEFFKSIGAIFTGKFSIKTADGTRRMLVMLVLSCLPLVVVYFLKDFFESFTTDSDILVEGICFLYTALLLTFASRRMKRFSWREAEDMRAGDALFVGIMQAIAALPGISRSGSTTSAALLCGYKKEYALNFSFVLGIPTILAACAVDFLDVMQQGIEVDIFPIAIGAVTAAVVGLLAILLIKWLIRSDRFGVFAVYMYIVGALTVAAALIEHFTGTPILTFVANLIN